MLKIPLLLSLSCLGCLAPAMWLCVGLVAAIAPVVSADVRLPHVLQSGMVLQQGVPLVIWGWGAPGEKIEVQLASQIMSAATGDDGRWYVEFPPIQSTVEPLQIIVKGEHNQLTLEDVLVGEVWIGSGQSNMEMPMTETGATANIDQANYPQIRLFHISHAKSATETDDVDASWQKCAPDSVAQFSAPLYYFGRHLHEELQVPIGLINASWGGSPIEQWTPHDASGEMYNAMVAPLTRYAVRGVVWYQGEANVYHNRGLEYTVKMQSLIGGWRTAWQQNLPWYFVQIAPWDYSGYPVGQVPAMWEAQAASLKIPNTGMVVTTDLVDPAGVLDGHPRNKQDVGVRLAKWALAKTYGHNDIIYSGPLFKSVSIEGDKLRLLFSHTAAGLKSRNGNPLSEFEVAGNNGHFANAVAEIDGHTVLVSSPLVPNPTQARFAWRTLPRPNLVNSAGLPASPFRTQDWQGGTAE